jgi:hypothetical protein
MVVRFSFIWHFPVYGEDAYVLEGRRTPTAMLLMTGLFFPKPNLQRTVLLKERRTIYTGSTKIPRINKGKFSLV